MNLKRWMMLIGVMVAVGCVQVAQRNALFLKGYAVGEQVKRLHVQETDLAWLNTRVTNLMSPTRLARVAQERQLKLIAWSMFSQQSVPSQGLSHVSMETADGQGVRGSQGFVHVAAIESRPHVPEEPSSD